MKIKHLVNYLHTDLSSALMHIACPLTELYCMQEQHSLQLSPSLCNDENTCSLSSTSLLSRALIPC
jgi:hypothetical protein